jgi:hypothetical protein
MNDGIARFVAAPSAIVSRAEPGASTKAARVVRAYYAWMLLIDVGHIVVQPHHGVLFRQHALWPVLWAPPLGFLGTALVWTAAVLGPLAAFMRQDRRWARILAFLGVLEYGAWANSFGKINHEMHLWVITALLLVFLPSPDHRETRLQRSTYLLVVWYTQAFVLMTYSMAGLAKLFGAALQWSHGVRFWLFSRDALAIHIAQHFESIGATTRLGLAIITHPWIGFGLMMMALGLELLALPVAFCPALHRFWGAALICMHVSIWAAIDVNFLPATPLLLTLLCGSPFAPPLGFGLRPARVQSRARGRE